MQELQLLIIALLLSLLGLTSTYFLIQEQQPTQITLEQIPEYEGKYVTLESKLNNLTLSRSQTQTMKLDTGIKAVIFKNTELTVQENKKYKLTGKISRYKGKLELIIEAAEWNP